MSKNVNSEYSLEFKNDALFLKINCAISESLILKINNDLNSNFDFIEVPNRRLVLSIHDTEKSDEDIKISRLKFIDDFSFQKVAVINGRKRFKMLTDWVLSLPKRKNDNPQIKYFKAKINATKWVLKNPNNRSSALSHRLKLLFLAGITVQLAALYGRFTQDAFYTRYAPGYNNISELTILFFLVILTCAFVYKIASSNDIVKWVCLVLLGTTIYLATLNIMLKIFNTSIQLDQFIKVSLDQSSSVPLSVITSIGIIFSAIAIIIALLQQNKKNKLSILGVDLIITGIVLSTLVPFIFSIITATTNITVTAINQSIPAGITLALIAFACTILFPKSTYGKILKRTNKGYLLAFAVGILLLIFTLTLVRESNNQIDKNIDFSQQENGEIAVEKIEKTIDAYVNGISAVRAFYNSSERVNPEEFNSFYEAMGLEQRYPGIYAVSYISQVNQEEYLELINELQNNSYLAGFNAQIPLLPMSESGDYRYIVTHIEPETFPKTAIGIDLSGSTREANFIDAKNRRKFTASESVDLGDVQKIEQNKGFFITMPVFTDGAEEPEGFINAVFEYEKLFGTAFKDSFDDIGIAVKDESGEIIYTKPASLTTGNSRQYDINVANRNWALELSYPQNFGAPISEINSVNRTLIGGIILSITITFLILVITGSNHRTQKLAKLITKDLEQERNRLSLKTVQSKALIESIGEGIIVTDQKGVITEVNPEAEKLLHTKEDKLLGKWYPKYIQLLDSAGNVLETKNRPDFQTIIDGKPIESRVYNIKLNRRIFPASITASPYIFNDSPIGIVIAFRDISKERELEHAKDDFIALASHQLRTPATAIKQFIGMFLEGYVGKITEEQRDILNEAYLSNERQIHITQDMLSVAKLESGSVELKLVENDLATLVEDALKEHESTIKERKQKVTLDAYVCETEVDVNLLRMVVDNLISNASKYTPEKGSISIKVKPSVNNFIISVQDSGVGISKDDQKKLFQRFSRIQNELSEKVGGSGLGLYIAKKIVKLHKGDIKVDSSEGNGTTFSVLLPITQKHKP